jgi:hypothetical protein
MSEAAVENSRQYVVEKGDSLWSIADRFLGEGDRWTEIYELNQMLIARRQDRPGQRHRTGPHWIYPGTVLVLPTEDAHIVEAFNRGHRDDEEKGVDADDIWGMRKAARKMENDYFDLYYINANLSERQCSHFAFKDGEAHCTLWDQIVELRTELARGRQGTGAESVEKTKT